MPTLSLELGNRNICLVICLHAFMLLLNSLFLLSKVTGTLIDRFGLLVLKLVFLMFKLSLPSITLFRLCIVKVRSAPIFPYIRSDARLRRNKSYLLL